METTTIFIFITVAAFALFIGYLLGGQQSKTKVAVLKAQKEEEEKHYQQSMKNEKQERENDLLDLKKQHDEQIKQLKMAHAELKQEQEERHQREMDYMHQQFEQTINNLNEKIELTTADVLKSRQEEFSKSSKQSLTDLVTPLNQSIADMKQVVLEYNNKQAEFSGAIKTNLDAIIMQTESARHSAEELTNALKHNVKVQGDYGEAILEELLISSGLTNGVHYETQITLRDKLGRVIKTDDGNMLRPDVIFHLDNQRDVIIDSKVSLTAFMDYVNAETEEKRQYYLSAHIDSIVSQVELLSKKDYSQYIEATRSRMDYVIMFIPMSAAWWTAVNREPKLWRMAMDKNVFIADEQTLFAALRIIKLTWTQIAQIENQKKVFALAEEMIDRVGAFMEQYNNMGQALTNAQRAFDNGMRKLNPNGQSILVTANKLKKIGARDSSKHPIQKYIDDEKLLEEES